MMIVTMIKKRW